MPILAGIGPLGPFELIVILVIVLLIFGVGRLPEVGGALGKSIKEFRNSSTDEANGTATTTATDTSAAAPDVATAPPTDVAAPAVPVVDGVFCSECGTKNTTTAKFCASCGKALPATVS